MMAAMDLFFRTITWSGSVLFLLPFVLLLGFVLLLRGRGTDALLILGGLGGAVALAHGLKRLFARPRPPVQDLLVAMPPDFSFPSAHTAQITAVALACAIAFSRDASTSAGLLICCGLGTIAILVGFSRIYLQVHYFSDVAAGAVLGASWVLLLQWLLRWAAEGV